MKKLFILLFSFILFFLIGCEDVTTNKTTVTTTTKMNETYAIVINEELNENNYLKYVNQMKTNLSDFDFEYSNYESRGKKYNMNITGSNASYSRTLLKKAETLSLYVSNYEHTKLVYIYTTDNDNNTNNFTQAAYETYDDKLEWGMVGIKNQNEFIHYIGPDDMPAQFPSASSGEPEDFGINTSLDEYLGLDLFRTLYNIGSIYTTPISFEEYEASLGDQTITDKPVHTFEVKDEYLIIEEKTLSPFIYDKARHLKNDTLFSYISTMKEKNSYYLRTFYYNLKTGLLEKMTFSFDTIDLFITVGTKLVGKATLTFKFDNYQNRINEAQNYVDFFKNYEGEKQNTR